MHAIFIDMDNKCLMIPKVYSEAVNQRRTDNYKDLQIPTQKTKDQTTRTS